MASPKLYTKRAVHPINLLAARLDEDNVGELANWCQGQLIQERDPLNDEIFDALNFRNANGEMERVSRGDWLVQTNKGFLRQPHEAFTRMYREVIHEEDEDASKPTHTIDPFEGMKRAGSPRA